MENDTDGQPIKKENIKMELTKKEETSILRTGVQHGFEEPVEKDDLIIPRAKLLQALSPEVQESPSEFHQGMIINSLTRETLPDIFIPVFKFTQWIRFNPRNQKDPEFNSSFGPGDIIWRSSDPYDPRVKKEGEFGPDGERPLATKFLNFLSYFPGQMMPIVISFANTSYRAGKQLLSLAKFSGKHMYARKYTLGCKQESNDMGTYFILTVRLSSDSEDKDVAIAESWWRDYHDRPVNVHEEQPEVAGSERPF
jgi:hypothetical protein